MEDQSRKTITVVWDLDSGSKKADTPVRHDASLIMLSGGTVGMMYKLPESGDVYIGRAPEAEIRIDHEGVSRKHARIAVRDGHPIIINDLGSTNGTYVNGTRVVEQTLHDGDKVQIGPQIILKFQYHDALEEDVQRKLFESAVKDGLTGIYNKKYFLDRIETDFSYAKRHHVPLTLILFDIDHFKAVNDTHGHPAGDHILKELAALVKRTVRNEDVFARFGGEEFAVLMRDVDDALGLMLAERLRHAVEKAVFEFDGTHIPLTISLGVGVMNGAGADAIQSSSDLVHFADQYLYKAKRDGRNRVACKVNET